MRMILMTLSCLSLPMMASAQDFAFDPAATVSCLQSGVPLNECAGKSAERCMDLNDGGYSTVGMGFCLSLEADYWDARLNASYQVVMELKRKEDRELVGVGPKQAEDLRTMQRAWIVYRDARCEFVRSTWGTGTGGGPAQMDCIMRETARQTLFLEEQTDLR